MYIDIYIQNWRRPTKYNDRKLEKKVLYNEENLMTKRVGIIKPFDVTYQSNVFNDLAC